MSIIRRRLDALQMDEMDGTVNYVDDTSLCDSDMTPVSKFVFGLAIVLILFSTVVF